jgi:hypothetical protein
MRQRLRTRLDRLDGRAQAPAVTIEMGLCDTEADYERAFAEAWAKVPPGSTVYCFLRDLSELEYLALVEGRQAMPSGVEGV